MPGEWPQGAGPPADSVRDLVEQEAIRRILHRYCALLDARRPDLLVSEVYAPDAVDDRRRVEPLRGSAALSAYFGGALAAFQATMHLLGNVVIDVDGDRARASSYVQASHWLAENSQLGNVRPAELVLVARYDDELMLLRTGWRISHRVLTVLGPGGLFAGVMPPAFAGFGGIPG